MNQKLKALLATGRISNLPTVWCNCLAAFLLIANLVPAIKYTFFISSSSLNNFVILASLLVVSSSLIYVGGCFLGDSIDEDFDKLNKPDRPIPSGILNRRIVCVFAWFMLILGAISPQICKSLLISKDVVITTMAGPNVIHQDFFLVTLALLTAVISYSFLHKKVPQLGLPLIGLCRLTLVIFAAGVTAKLTTTLLASNGHSYYIRFLFQPIILFAAAVCLYTICFASVARTESSDSPITWRKVLRYTMLGLPFVALISKSSFHGGYLEMAALAALAIYALWMIHAFSYLSKNKGIYVSKCLAGFCLLDACFVAQFGWIWLIICLGLFGMALMLQKIAPAT